jgi:hypothetical protein
VHSLTQQHLQGLLCQLVMLNTGLCLQDNVQADGVKESEVKAAAELAAAGADATAAGSISAKVVKELREKSGAGMMACKKALSEADGDFDKVSCPIQTR